MRSADRFDLADLDFSTIDLPASGERSLRDSVVPACARLVKIVSFKHSSRKAADQFHTKTILWIGVQQGPLSGVIGV